MPPTPCRGSNAGATIDNSVSDIQIKVLGTLVAKTTEERKQLQQDIASLRDAILKQMDDYEKTISTAADRDLFGKLKEARDQYVSLRGQLFQLEDAGKMDEAFQFNASTLKPAFLKYKEQVSGLLEFNGPNAKTATAQIVQAVDRANLVSLAASVFVVLMGVTAVVVIVTGLSKVLNRVASALDDGASQIASAAGQVSSSSQSLAEGASEQASSLEETSASLEEMASMTKRNAENSRKANELGRQTREAAERGAAEMQQMSAAMDAIRDSSDDIAKIIKTIDEIAFQTNILALNAAVEAARAGEAGMGFAVVAEEVRSLAQRSAQAAKETSAKIEGAISKTGQGVEISAKVAKALGEIVARARQVDELVAEVAGASGEQSQGIAQVNLAVGQMDQVTQGNAASAEESAAAAQELNAQAETMKGSVGELLRLVGSDSRHAGTGLRSAPVKAAAAANPPPAMKRPPMTAPPKHSMAKGSSDAASSASASASTAQKRAAIPLEGDFKDF